VIGQPSPADSRLDELSRRANRLAEWVMAALLVAMTLLVGVQVAGRFVFGYSLFWSDELARFLLVWISFLGISVGARRAAHPGVDTLVKALPARWAQPALRLAILVSLVFFAVMVVSGGALVLRTWPQASTSLGIRMGIPYLAVPVSGLLMGLHTAALGLRGNGGPEPGVRGGQ
jgi:TRAP-type C4-dicarboxylate transport system permease small subunit